MSAKTPYELRASLLYLAQGICNDKNSTVRQQLENDWNMKREAWEKSGTSATNARTPNPPPFPEMPTVSTEEVIAEARKLNDFVSNG